MEESKNDINNRLHKSEDLSDHGQVEAHTVPDRVNQTTATINTELVAEDPSIKQSNSVKCENESERNAASIDPLQEESVV